MILKLFFFTNLINKYNQILLYLLIRKKKKFFNLYFNLIDYFKTDNF